MDGWCFSGSLLLLGLTVCSQAISSTTGNDVSDCASSNRTNGSVSSLDVRKVKDNLVNVSWSMDDEVTGNASGDNSTTLSSWVVSYQIVLFNDSITHKPSGQQGASTTHLSDDGLEFRSSNLSPEVRSISLHLPCSSCKIRISVYLVADQNEGQNLSSSEKKCMYWKNSGDGDDDDGDDKKNDEEVSETKKLIVGISAGCVFLVPCVFVLVLIMKKDRQMRAASIYEELGKERLNPGYELGNDEKGMGKGVRDGEKKEGGANSGACDVEWKSLSVGELTGVKVPAIYVHSGDDDSDDGSDVGVYSERL